MTQFSNVSRKVTTPLAVKLLVIVLRFFSMVRTSVRDERLRAF